MGIDTRWQAFFIFLIRFAVYSVERLFLNIHRVNPWDVLIKWPDEFSTLRINPFAIGYVGCCIKST